MDNNGISVDVEKIYRLASEHDIPISRLEIYAKLANGTIKKWDKADPKVSSLIRVSEVLGIDPMKLIKK